MLIVIIVSSTTHYGSPLVFTRAARRVGVPWPGPVACPWACRGLCTLRRALLSACMSQCGPFRLVYLGSERAVMHQMWPLWCALSTFPQKTRQVSGPSSELLAQAYAGAARPVARLGLASRAAASPCTQLRAVTLSASRTSHGIYPTCKNVQTYLLPETLLRQSPEFRHDHSCLVVFT